MIIKSEIALLGKEIVEWYIDMSKELDEYNNELRKLDKHINAIKSEIRNIVGVTTYNYYSNFSLETFIDRGHMVDALVLNELSNEIMNTTYEIVDIISKKELIIEQINNITK